MDQSGKEADSKETFNELKYHNQSFLEEPRQFVEQSLWHGYSPICSIRNPNSYCPQMLNPQIEQYICKCLSKLSYFDHRTRLNHPLKAKKNKRIVTGFKEIASHLKYNFTQGKQMILIVPIDLNASLTRSKNWHTVFKRAEELDLPIYYGLTSSEMAVAMGRASGMTVTLTGILNLEGVRDEHKILHDLCMEGRRLWQQAALEYLQDDLLSSGNVLSILAFHGHSQIIRAAIESHREFLKCRVNYADASSGVTPFMRACDGGHFHCIREFLELGGDVMTEDFMGNTPFHYLAIMGSPGSFNLMVNGRDREELLTLMQRRTPKDTLELAIDGLNTDLLLCLLSFGHQVDYYHIIASVHQQCNPINLFEILLKNAKALSTPQIGSILFEITKTGNTNYWANIREILNSHHGISPTKLVEILEYPQENGLSTVDLAVSMGYNRISSMFINLGCNPSKLKSK